MLEFTKKQVDTELKESESTYFQYYSSSNVLTLFIISNDKEYFSDSLQKYDYGYVFCEEFELAKKLLTDQLVHDPDLKVAVICDYELLKNNNFEFIDYIKKDYHLSKTPVIAISGDEESKEREINLSDGLDDIYSTPFSIEDLIARVFFLLEYKKEKIKMTRDELEREETTLLKKRIKVPFFKRVFDIMVSSLLLLVLSPILLLIAVAIRIESRGPIFYISKRAGRGYQIFDFYKFRSMYADADKRLAEILHLNQYSDDGGSAFIKIENDPRVTRLGKILRKTSLDELPQLINVLKGDMSIVGNRPLPLYEAENLTKDDSARRFLAPAGITGLWQVSKRGKKDMSARERIDLDISYTNEHSIKNDIKILYKTIPALIQEEAV